MPQKLPHKSVVFRTATEVDCADLALFANMATRGMTSHLWRRAALPGQSAFEVGRTVIHSARDHYTHYTNWRVAELENRVVGALNGYFIPEPPRTALPAPDIVKPLNELKNLAARTWYISAVAIYSEYQGSGFGSLLLSEAERIAGFAGASRVTLVVGSFNPGAHRLYRRHGFVEWARRPFVAFPNSDEGEWILMVKNLAQQY